MRLEDAVRRLRRNDPALTQLSSCAVKGGIGDKAVVELADALRHNTYLECLDWRGHDIGNEGAMALAGALCQNASLTSLSLYWNNVGNEGAMALAVALSCNASLMSLNLSRNNVGDEGATALADALCHNAFLISLNLSHNNVGDEGARALADALCHNASLTQLHLQGAGDLADELLEEINFQLRMNRRDGPVLAAARKMGRFPEEQLQIPLRLLPTGIARIGRMDSFGTMFAFVREKHSDMLGAGAQS